MGGAHHCSGRPVSEMTYTVYCVEWDVKLYRIPYHTIPYHTGVVAFCGIRYDRTSVEKWHVMRVKSLIPDLQFGDRDDDGDVSAWINDEREWSARRRALMCSE